MREHSNLKVSKIRKTLLDYQVLVPSKWIDITAFSLAVAVYNFLFLYYFRPFKIDASEIHRLYFSMGYGLVTMLSLFLTFLFLRIYFHPKPTGLLTTQQFFWLAVLSLIFISLNSWFYTKLLGSDTVESYSLIGCMGYVASIALIPLGIMILVSHILLYSKDDKPEIVKPTEVSETVVEADELEDNLILDIRADRGNDHISFLRKEFICAISDENYCKIFLNINGKTINHHIRISLLSIENQLIGNGFVRCHKTALINPTHILSVSGNSKNRKMTLAGIPNFQIPVSRTFID